MAQRHGNANSIGRLIAREMRSGNRLKDGCAPRNEAEYYNRLADEDEYQRMVEGQ